jgi:hypothetical protein
MRTLLVAAVFAPAEAIPAAAQTAPVSGPPVAAKFLGLFDQLRSAEAHKAAGKLQPFSFRLSDAEINDYLRYSLKAIPRPGLDSVTVKIFALDYVSTFAIVDFDAVEKWKPGTIPALLRPVLQGKKSIWVDYRFQAADSKVKFSVEKAYYQNLRLPAFFVEKMIQVVAARQPEKYDTTKPLPLPFGLKRISTAEHLIMGEN